jgi:uncharacterized protein DUF2380/4-hydroxyphenylacetate 3-hydroxylase-like protein
MLMTAADYRESLRAYKPRVFVNGQRVESVADEPLLAPGINGVGVTYDFAHQAEHVAVMTARQGGKTVNRMLHINENSTDLFYKLEVVRLVCKVSGCAQRYLTQTGGIERQSRMRGRCGVSKFEGAVMRLVSILAILVFGAAFAVSPAAADAPRSAAVFDPVFVDSSLEPVSPAETERLHHLYAALRSALANSGQYRPVDLAPIQAKLAAINDLHSCNGCERDLSHELGAQLAVVTWVQKVSNLILNINIRIEEVATGRTIKGGSVDIRGNTDETWNRGLKYLLEEHVFEDRP